MHRQQLWTFDTASIDFEDLDAVVTATHGPSLAQICIRFRLTRAQLNGEVETLRKRLEYLAADKVLDLASFLDSRGSGVF